MKSSCLVKSILLVTGVSLAVRADIAPPNSHLVQREVAIVNAGSFPDKVFIGLEFYPGKSSPVWASRLGAGTRFSVSYKLNRMEIYSAAAAAWPALKDKYGISDGSGEDGTTLNADLADRLCCSGELVAVTGAVDAAPQYVADTSKLASEVMEYQVQGKNADQLALYGRLQTFKDGSNKEFLLGAAGVRDNQSLSRKTHGNVRVTLDGRTMLWSPDFSGIASVRLMDAMGKSVWSAHRAVTAGETEALPLGALAQGRYVLTAQGLGGSQSASITIGNR